MFRLPARVIYAGHVNTKIWYQIDFSRAETTGCPWPLRPGTATLQFDNTQTARTFIDLDYLIV